MASTPVHAFCLRSFAVNVFRVAVIIMVLCLHQGLQMVQARPAPAAQALTPWHCYNDGSLDPCHNTLNSVHFLDSSNAWAVGNGGTILRYQNGAWSVFPSPVLSNLLDVQYLSAEEAWAVGGDVNFLDTPSMLRWNGTSWTEFSLSVPNMVGFYLKSIFMLNANEGWVFGSARGKTEEDDIQYDDYLLHWNGSMWQPVSTEDFPSNTSWENATVWASAVNDLWVFSEVTMHWDGANWSQVETPGEILSVSPLAPDDIWAIGLDESYNEVILHWNGESWSVQYIPDSLELTSIAMLSNTQGWVMGRGWGSDGLSSVYVALHWNGVGWQEIPVASKARLFSIAVIGGEDAWAVGYDGVILHWHNAGWQVVVGKEDTYGKMLDVALISSTDGWAAGYDGIIKHFDGQDWLDWSSPTTNDLYFVEAHSENDLWITGEDILLHWEPEAQEWRVFSYMANDPLPQGSYPPNFGWEIVNEENGVRLNSWNAELVKWETTFYPLPITPSSIYMATPQYGWVVGYSQEDGTTTYHWDGESWGYVEFSDSGLGRPNLRGFGANDVWIIGEHTAHWDGMAWQNDLGMGFAIAVNDLDKVGQDDYFAIDYTGKVTHRNTGGSTQSRLPTGCMMNAIDMLSTTKGWAVGQECPFIYTGSLDEGYQLFLPIVQ